MEIIVIDHDRYTDEIKRVLETVSRIRNRNDKEKYGVGIFSEHLFAEEKMTSAARKTAIAKNKSEEEPEKRDKKLSEKYRKLVKRSSGKTGGTEVIRLRTGEVIAKYRKDAAGYYMIVESAKSGGLSQEEIGRILGLLDEERRADPELIAVAIP